MDQPVDWGPVASLVETVASHLELLSKAVSQGDYFRVFHAHHGVVNAGLQLQSMLASKPGIEPWGEAAPPDHVINRVMGEGELQYFVENILSTAFRVRDVQALQERLLEWTSFLIEEFGEAFGQQALPRPAAELVDDLRERVKRHELRNFRPVSGTSRVFRSTMPGQYAGNPALREWFDTHDIKTVIDLRRPEEIDAVPNEPAVADVPGVKIVHVNFNSTPDATTPPVHDYVRGLITRKSEIATVFEEILASSGSTLIHCVAGKDRTGILSALVQLIAGVSRNAIVEDYVRSGHESVPSRISLSLDHVEKEGGIRAFLASCGFPAEKQTALLAKIAPRP